MENKIGGAGAILDSLDEQAKDDGNVFMGQVVDARERRGYGLLLFVPALVGVSPINAVPGVSSILALIIALVAGQVALGRESM